MNCLTLFNQLIMGPSPDSIQVYSDLRLGLEWHLEECRNLIAVADLMGLIVSEVGVHGSVPTVFLFDQAGNQIGRLYEFTFFRDGTKCFSYHSTFDTRPFGIDCVADTSDWKLHI
jgi:hypothetical protein